ncbi:MAG: HisA/HisF-related TIM barrel protein [Actinomycetes bacterium]
MRLYPAIDLLGRRTVRLRRGDYDDGIVYDAEPAEAAAEFVSNGARTLHLVDLEGARSGRPEQLDVVAAIRAAVDVPIELGGGLRTIDDLRSAAAVGVDRLVLGTAAIDNAELVEVALGEFGQRLVVSVDGRNGLAATDGWTQGSGEAVATVFERLQAQGVTRFVYSAIERDGMLGGPALDEVLSVGAVVRGSFLYAGGVASVEDLAALRALKLVNLEGVIVGRALHEGRFTVAEGNSALED